MRIVGTALSRPCAILRCARSGFAATPRHARCRSSRRGLGRSRAGAPHSPEQVEASTPAQSRAGRAGARERSLQAQRVLVGCRTSGRTAGTTTLGTTCGTPACRSVEEVSAIASVAEGLTPPMRSLASAGPAPGARRLRRCADAPRASGSRVRHSAVSSRTTAGSSVRPTGATTTAASSRTARAAPRRASTGCARAATRATGRSRGGAGYSWVVVHHEADFSCATPWWFPLNDSLWMEPAFDSYGNAG